MANAVNLNFNQTMVSQSGDDSRHVGIQACVLASRIFDTRVCAHRSYSGDCVTVQMGDLDITFSSESYLKNPGFPINIWYSLESDDFFEISNGGLKKVHINGDLRGEPVNLDFGLRYRLNIVLKLLSKGWSHFKGEMFRDTDLIYANALMNGQFNNLNRLVELQQLLSDLMTSNPESWHLLYAKLYALQSNVNQGLCSTLMGYCQNLIKMRQENDDTEALNVSELHNGNETNRDSYSVVDIIRYLGLYMDRKGIQGKTHSTNKPCVKGSVSYDVFPQSNKRRDVDLIYRLQGPEQISQVASFFEHRIPILLTDSKEHYLFIGTCFPVKLWCLQGAVRNWLQRRYDSRQKAAIPIQAIIRRYFSISRVAKLRSQRKVAASYVIQQCFRFYRVRYENRRNMEMFLHAMIDSVIESSIRLSAEAHFRAQIEANRESSYSYVFDNGHVTVRYRDTVFPCEWRGKMDDLFDVNGSLKEPEKYKRERFMALLMKPKKGSSCVCFDRSLSFLKKCMRLLEENPVYILMVPAGQLSQNFLLSSGFSGFLQRVSHFLNVMPDFFCFDSNDRAVLTTVLNGGTFKISELESLFCLIRRKVNDYASQAPRLSIYYEHQLSSWIYLCDMFDRYSELFNSPDEIENERLYPDFFLKEMIKLDLEDNLSRGEDLRNTLIYARKLLMELFHQTLGTYKLKLANQVECDSRVLLKDTSNLERVEFVCRKLGNVVLEGDKDQISKLVHPLLDCVLVTNKESGEKVKARILAIVKDSIENRQRYSKETDVFFVQLMRFFSQRSVDSIHECLYFVYPDSLSDSPITFDVFLAISFKDKEAFVKGVRLGYLQFRIRLYDQAFIDTIDLDDLVLCFRELLVYSKKFSFLLDDCSMSLYLMSHVASRLEKMDDRYFTQFNRTKAEYIGSLVSLFQSFFPLQYLFTKVFSWDLFKDQCLFLAEQLPDGKAKDDLREFLNRHLRLRLDLASSKQHLKSVLDKSEKLKTVRLSPPPELNHLEFTNPITEALYGLDPKKWVDYCLFNVDKKNIIKGHQGKGKKNCNTRPVSLSSLMEVKLAKAFVKKGNHSVRVIRKMSSSKLFCSTDLYPCLFQIMGVNALNEMRSSKLDSKVMFFYFWRLALAPNIGPLFDDTPYSEGGTNSLSSMGKHLGSLLPFLDPEVSLILNSLTIEPCIL